MSSYFAHDTVVIDEGSHIGEGCKIWHFCHLSNNSALGNNCVLGQNVYIGPNTQIGNNVKIQNNVSVYEGVELEDDVFCGPSVVFTNVINPRAFIKRTEQFKKTRIKQGASLGANATILPGVTIGQYAFVAAAATVTKNVPDFALVIGSPATQAGWISKAGHRLDFSESNNQAKCAETGEVYSLANGLCELVTSDGH